MILTIQKFLIESPGLAIFVVFWAGALASLSSCTLIRIPIVVGLVAGASDSRKKSLCVTFSFVTGIIVSYTVLGLLLGFIGTLASGLLQVSKYIFCALGIVMLCIGISVSGLIKSKKHASGCHINSGLNNKLKGISNGGYFGAFLFGITFAFLEMPACPCCGSVLFVIAGLVVIKNSFFYSIVIFFSFALGQSFPILLIGSSTGLVKNLSPRLKKFEGYIKLISGNILIVMGIYFLIIA